MGTWIMECSVFRVSWWSHRCVNLSKKIEKKCTLEIDTNYHIYTNYTSIKVDLDTIIHAGYNAESLVPTSVFEVVVGGGVQVSVLPIHGAQGNKWAGAPDRGDSDRKEAQGPGCQRMW